METKMEKIAKAARIRPNEKVTSLIHLINEETVKQCHRGISTKKSAGVDKVTKEEYEQDLDENVEGLTKRIKRQTYKPGQ